MSTEEEAALLAIAKKHRSLSRHGRTSGEPSWRVLIHDIAEGRLAVVSATSRQVAPEHKKAESREFKFHQNSPPKWWQSGMKVEDLIQKTGMPSEKLAELGFGVDQFATPPFGWRKWGAVPSWWVEGESAGMPLADAIAASGMTAKQLVAAGYEILGQGEDREVLP